MKRISILLTVLLMSTTLISAKELKSNELGNTLGMDKIHSQDLHVAGSHCGENSSFYGGAFNCYSNGSEHDKNPHGPRKIVEIIP